MRRTTAILQIARARLHAKLFLHQQTVGEQLKDMPFKRLSKFVHSFNFNRNPFSAASQEIIGAPRKKIPPGEEGLLRTQTIVKVYGNNLSARNAAGALLAIAPPQEQQRQYQKHECSYQRPVPSFTQASAMPTTKLPVATKGRQGVPPRSPAAGGAPEADEPLRLPPSAFDSPLESPASDTTTLVDNKERR